MNEQEHKKALESARKRLRRPKDDKCVDPDRAKKMVVDALNRMDQHADRPELPAWHQETGARIQAFMEKNHTCYYGSGEPCPLCCGAARNALVVADTALNEAMVVKEKAAAKLDAAREEYDAALRTAMSAWDVAVKAQSVVDGEKE